MSGYKNGSNNNMLWEQGGRRFESCYPDRENQGVTEIVTPFLFVLKYIATPQKDTNQYKNILINVS